MSLRRLMSNYMTIQSSELSNQHDVGSIDRAGSWVNLSDFENVRCNIQEKSKQTVTERFSKQQEEHNDLIYHQSRDLYNLEIQTTLRIIVLKSNPHTRILNFSIDDSDLDIYEFKGHVEQVKGVRRRKLLFILRCERNDMWSK